MSVVSVKETASRRRTWRDSNGWHHVRIWRVICDTATDGPRVAATATGIPAWNAEHPQDSQTRVQQINVETVAQDDRTFDVTVQYDQVKLQGFGQQEEDPLDRPPIITVDSEDATEEYFFDAENKAVVNSAGFPFDAVPVRDASVLVITIVRNEAFRDIADDYSYSNTVNADTVTIDGQNFAAGKLKMAPIRSEFLVEGQHEYYRYTYRIKARADGWNQKFQDVTYYEKVAGEPREIKVEGKAIRKPWPLDGEGGLKEDFDDEPAVLTFKPYVEKAWSPRDFS